MAAATLSKLAWVNFIRIGLEGQGVKFERLTSEQATGAARRVGGVVRVVENHRLAQPVRPSPLVTEFSYSVNASTISQPLYSSMAALSPVNLIKLFLPIWQPFL